MQVHCTHCRFIGGAGGARIVTVVAVGAAVLAVAVAAALALSAPAALACPAPAQVELCLPAPEGDAGWTAVDGSEGGADVANVAYVFSGAASADALRDDLRRIYAARVEVDPGKVTLLAFAAGTVMLVDRELYDEINSSPRDPVMDRWGDVITDLGTGAATLGISGLVALRDPETGYLAANAVIYSGLSCAILKAAFGRARPGLGEGPYAFSGPCIREGYNSLPSGHSAAVFALATVLARQYPEYRVLFYAGATLVAISRVYERAHWPSDTLVGAVVGVWSANQVMGRSRLFEVTW